MLGVGGTEPSQRLPVNFTTTLAGFALTNSQPADKVVIPEQRRAQGRLHERDNGGDAVRVAHLRPKRLHQDRFRRWRPDWHHERVRAAVRGSHLGTGMDAHPRRGVAGRGTRRNIGYQHKRDIAHRRSDHGPRNDGGGTVTAATGLRIDSPTIGTTKREIHATGTAESYFEGPVKTNNQRMDSGTGIIQGQSLVAGAAGAGRQGRFTAVANSDGALAVVAEGTSTQTADILRTQRGVGIIRSRFDGQGRLGCPSRRSPPKATWRPARRSCTSITQPEHRA